VMLPLVTLLGLSLGSLLGGTAVVEIIYNWPGMGNMAVKAISCRDYPLSVLFYRFYCRYR
ncbi:MAG: ABC transporter permease subunit, partial [Blautia sp.]|uniref:ABC transporter permease subunit n=1 Tax=Blautia sp. TaxID=1955243 RepID=UPI0025C06034